jgi:hypothetical protein
MSKGRSRYEVELADSTVHEVETDGRDWAAMEAKQFPLTARLTMVRFMVFKAMVRSAGYRRSWEQFNDQDCVYVEDITPVETDSEDEESLDPGPTATNGPAGSTSPSRPGSRSTAPAVS